MDLISTDIKAIDRRGNTVYIFSASGVDVYRLPDWTRTAQAALASVTCGAINDNGIWLGTAANGVYRLRYADARGESTRRLIHAYTTSTAAALQSEAITGLAGTGTALLVTTAAGADFLPDLGTVHSYAAASGCGPACAISATDIAYAVSTGSVHVLVHPSADWVEDDVTVIGESTTTLHESTFTATDGTSLSSYTPETGSGFTALSGGMEIVSNKAQNVSSTAAAREVTNAGESDCTVEADLTFAAVSAGQGFVLRALDASNRWFAGYSYGAGAWLIGAVISGTWTQHASTADTLTDGQTYHLRAELAGETISLYVDDVLKVEYASATDLKTETLHGVEIGLSTSPKLDNFEISIQSQVTVQALAYGVDLFIGAADGLQSYDGTDITDHTALLGTVKDVKALWPSTTATATTGLLAYGTSDGAAGGQFAVVDLAASTEETSASGDIDGAVWIDDDLEASLADATLTQYTQVTARSPAPGARSVPVGWSLYAEITDSLGGIAASSAVLKVGGATVAHTETAITDGYRIEYAPASDSGYAQRIAVTISATDADGNTVSRSWTFTTESAPADAATDAAVPNVVCLRDISLASAEADETVEGVNVIWLDEITSPLIVTESQAKQVGAVAIDGQTYHRHLRTVRVLAEDAATVATAGLQQGEIITLDCPAIGMTGKACEVLAVQRSLSRAAGVEYTLRAAYYEAV